MSAYFKLNFQEKEQNESLRLKIRQQEVTIEQLRKDLADSKTKLEIETAKHPSGGSADTKGWKSAVVTRMYEGKLKALEEDLEKKVSAFYVWILILCNMMTSSNGDVSALLAICAGNSPVPGEFPAQRPVTRSFDVFFDLRLNKRLSKQSWGWWFETPSRPLWRHHNEMLRCTSEPLFTKKTPSYWYRDSHCEPETVIKQS